MKYLKKFDTHLEYNIYIGTGGKDLPNVSYCVDNDELHYTPENRIVATFTIVSNSYAYIFGGMNKVKDYFSEIEIDGELLTLPFN